MANKYNCDAYDSGYCYRLGRPLTDEEDDKCEEFCCAYDIAIGEINMRWKEELTKMIENGCTDSNIEDFIDEHPTVNGKEIWDYVYEYDAPDDCKGCRFIQMSGMMPCIRCTRRVKVKDYYENR